MEVALDQVFIRNLETYCILGTNNWEREVQQKVCLDLCLHGDYRAAGLQDQLGLTVDYKRVAKTVLELVSSSQFFLVEALAEAVATLILQQQPQVQAVTVTVRKPGAVRFAEEVGITIHRRREDLP
ncbi:MAG: dihydroneopterin aldolase [Thermoanaerobaculum sp.]|nr:dihydroneopterin aldolase [Thermoanaerobaculum sp.]MDW7966554.1 dihydroneopterin aldolase [Thermoanaerobaculum sp.]